MKTYRITNMSSLSIVIEDIGVALPGPHSTATVDESLLNASRLIGPLMRYLKVEEVKPRLPVWPLAVEKPTRITTVATKKSIPVPKPAPATPPVVQSASQKTVVATPALASPVASNAVLERRVEDLTGKLDRLVDVLMKNASSPTVVHVNSSSPQAFGQAPVAKSDEPIFIPSSVVPKTDTASLTMKTSEVKTSNLEGTVDLLRQMRGKK